MRVDRAREVLGVTADADLDTIRRRYHGLARDLHPDAGGDEDEFKDLQTAYRVLVQEQPPRTTRSSSRPGGSAPPPPAPDPEVDVSTVDWGRPAPAAGAALDLASLAVAGALLVPVAPVRARSLGPRSRFGRAAGMVDERLTALLETGVVLGDGSRGIRITTERGRLRNLLLGASLPDAWTIRRTGSDEVIASRPVLDRPYARVNALLHATLAEQALTSLGWPLGQWRVVDERPA